MDEQLYTMSDMARILKSPASTVRSHCERFDRYLPYTGEGKDRRYLHQALEMLQVVANCYARKMTTPQIEELLAREYGQNIYDSQSQQQATLPHQQGVTAQQQLLLTQQQAVAMMMLVANAFNAVSEELQEIRGELKDIKQQQAVWAVISPEEIKEHIKKKPGLLARLAWWR